MAERVPILGLKGMRAGQPDFSLVPAMHNGVKRDR
jgi:hypothetical protein